MHILIVLCISFMFAACNKPAGFKKLKDTDNYLFMGDWQPGAIFEEPQYSALLEGNQILQITSSSELDSLVALGNSMSNLSDNNQDMRSMVAGVDFSEQSVYLFFAQMRMQEYPSIEKENVYVDKDEDEILFAFKVKVPVGGSGMIDRDGFWFVVLPKSYDNHSITANLFVNEAGGILGLEGNNYSLSYELQQ